MFEWTKTSREVDGVSWILDITKVTLGIDAWADQMEMGLDYVYQTMKSLRSFLGRLEWACTHRPSSKRFGVGEKDLTQCCKITGWKRGHAHLILACDANKMKSHIYKILNMFPHAVTMPDADCSHWEDYVEKAIREYKLFEAPFKFWLVAVSSKFCQANSPWVSLGLICFVLYLNMCYLGFLFFFFSVFSIYFQLVGNC